MSRVNTPQSREGVEATKRGAVTPARKRMAYERAGGVCSLCGNLVEFNEAEWDHDIEVWLGGKDVIIPVHKSCHRAKTDARASVLAKVRRLIKGPQPSKRPVRARGFQKDGPKRKIPSRPFPKR